MKDVPLLKKKSLTEVLAIPIDKETKDFIYKLKSEKGINTPELLRQFIKNGLEELKNN